VKLPGGKQAEEAKLAYLYVDETLTQKHRYIRNYHLLDGRVGTASSRQGAMRRRLLGLKPEVVMPLAIGDAAPAVRVTRRAGSNVASFGRRSLEHFGTLADHRSEP
jgi:hypothetical protein